MTSQQRFLRALSFEPVDRVPFNFWADRTLLTRYEERFGPYFRPLHYGADVWECLGLFAAVGPLFPAGHEAWANDDGVTHRVPFCKSAAELGEYEWAAPDPEGVRQAIRADRERLPDTAIILNTGGGFGALDALRFHENIFCDLHDDPDAVRRCLAGYTDRVCELLRTLADEPFDAVYLQDDICCTHGPMIAPEMMERFYWGHNAQIVEAGHALGKPVLFHTDGKIDQTLLDKCVDLGIAAVNPLQTHLHDYAWFKRRYHGRLAVYGGLDNTYIIGPDYSPADIRAHVLEVFHTLGEGFGLCLSSHDIDIRTPDENIEMMVRTIVEECCYEQPPPL